MSWLHKVRLRALGLMLGLGFATIGLLSLWTLPAWSLVGVAVAVVAVAVNTMGSRLSRDTCLNCGGDLTNLPRDTYGTICPGCGSVQTTTFQRFAFFDTQAGDPGSDDAPVVDVETEDGESVDARAGDAQTGDADGGSSRAHA